MRKLGIARFQEYSQGVVETCLEGHKNNLDTCKWMNCCTTHEALKPYYIQKHLNTIELLHKSLEVQLRTQPFIWAHKVTKCIWNTLFKPNWLGFVIYHQEKSIKMYVCTFQQILWGWETNLSVILVSRLSLLPVQCLNLLYPHSCPNPTLSHLHQVKCLKGWNTGRSPMWGTH